MICGRNGPGAVAGGGGDWKECAGASKSLERVRSPEDEGDALCVPCTCPMLDGHPQPSWPAHMSRASSMCSQAPLMSLCVPHSLCALALDDKGLTMCLSHKMEDFPMELPLAKTLIASVNLGVFQGDPVYHFNVVCSECVLSS